MIRYFCLLILLILVLGGCSGADEPKEKFTAEDMGIVRLDNGQKVYYGMNRAEAEEVLGKAKSMPGAYLITIPASRCSTEMMPLSRSGWRKNRKVIIKQRAVLK